MSNKMKRRALAVAMIAAINALLIALAQIGLGVACVTEEFSKAGLERGLIRPLKTAFTIPPREPLFLSRDFGL